MFQQSQTVNTTTSNITKREILRESSKIYDPLGLLTPVTIRAKILLQELWKNNFSWDEPLPPIIQKKWLILSNGLETATQTQFPRQYFPSSSTWPFNTTLHIFVDASMKAYGAVAYVSNRTNTSLVMAKSRVAPVETLTLHQLELMAAVIGARLYSYLQPNIQSSAVYFWSDSQIVLHWLSSNRDLKRFVSNRLKEIQSATKTTSWCYCPIAENPADLLTRGMQASDLLASTCGVEVPHG